MENINNLEYRRKRDFLALKLSPIQHLLDDKNVYEISRNQDEIIWISTFSDGYIDSKLRMSDFEAEDLLKVIASYNDRVVNDSNPILESKLLNGERFEGILGTAVDNHPIFSIRKRSEKVFYLDQFLEWNTITKKQKDFIVNAVNNKKNILVIGGVGTGKTTFLNACLQELNNSKDRIQIIEEINELRITAPNSNFCTTTEDVSFDMLIRASMRLNMDRIMLGEIRDGKAAEALLKAWNSGHPGGLSTIHANSNGAGLKKVEQYLSEVTLRVHPTMICEAINVVVNMVKDGEKRIVKEIAEVRGYDYEKLEYILEVI